LFLKEVLLPQATWHFSLKELFKIVGETLQWLGTIFAASYAALYTRFSSQWIYLADMYNKIMAAQASQSVMTDDSKRTFEVWKSAFIEDAEEVHLATKPGYAGIILSWLKIPEVRMAYIDNTPGGIVRLKRLEKLVKDAFEQEHKKQGGDVESPPQASS
jgi:hypothetical protein